MLSASVASQIVFISTLKQTAGGWVSVLIGGERGRNEDDTYIVYVQPGSIYLAIGAKTSSVQNIVVYGTWLVCVTRKISIRQTSCFSTGENVPGIHLLRPSSYTQVTLTDCSSQQPEEEGPCDSFALHCTQLRESCTFSLWRHIKKLCIPQKRYNEKF